MNLEYILSAHGIGGISKDKIPPPPISDFVVAQDGVNNNAILTWTNPVDTDFVGLIILRKIDSDPIDTNDGVLVYTGGASTYTDVGLIRGTTYHYRAFTFDWDKNYNMDISQQVKIFIKFEQTAPVSPSVSNIKYNEVTITGATGTEVNLNNGEWYNSPHTFTGLSPLTTYNAYARKKETTTQTASPSSASANFTTLKEPDDLTNAPGPKFLIRGNMQAGFFGVVPASELFTGAEISNACGITAGTLQFSDVGWLKCAIDGEIIFKSQKPYRHTISHDNINAVGAVLGTKQVAKGGITYKVTLMKGGNGNAADAVNGPKGSEWNRLMLPIHIKAKDQSWAYPANVTTPTPYWGIDFTDADLQTISSAGNGSYQWCQEVFHSGATYRVLRGSGGVSYSYGGASSLAHANYGWSPVLRVIS